MLSGTKVLEIAQNFAVPYCGRLLAGMGADVVKVEPPGGDAMRHLATLPSPEGWGPESKAFAALNVSKRSVCLDLDQPSSRTALEALVRWADVVLLGLKPTDVSQYGLGYEQLAHINSRVVCLDIVPFGSHGPDRDEPGYDVLVQARSGQSYVTARTHPSGSIPLNTRPAYNDFGTGMLSALGVLAALLRREQTGKGERVESSLLGTAMAFLTPIAFSADVVDAEAVDEFLSDLAAFRSAGASFAEERALYEDRVLPGGGRANLYFRHYRTADGVVSVGSLSPVLIRRFHDATGLPDPVPVEEAERRFLDDTTAGWIERLRAHGVPATRCVTPVEAMSDPQVVDNGWIVELEHPAFGRYRTTGMPIAFGDGAGPPMRPSPGLGHHSREVLAEAGLDAAAIEALIESGATRTGGAAP